ncbi:hypothetical protein ABEB36_004742 [Hypothenemus hampei]|uniref:Uncharacterized protein n=1 Tax=Hypothenemus hampei TaxID=57062 RepID=A0ABD1F4A2_HYPHA
MQADRQRIRERLDATTRRPLSENTKRRDTIQYAVGEFVLMHRSDKMHKSKLHYEFQGLFEIVGITPDHRYELRRVGKTVITKAVKEQLRRWPTDWSLSVDMPDLLEFIENDSKEGDKEDDVDSKATLSGEEEITDNPKTFPRVSSDDFEELSNQK